jgi:tRNA A37 methylthiotransferase MiaB
MKVYISNIVKCESITYFGNQIFEFFIRNNYEVVSHPSMAEVIVVFTCTSVKETKDLSVSELKKILRRYGRRKKIIAYGCITNLSGNIPNVHKIIWIKPYDLYEFNRLFRHSIAIEKINKNTYSDLYYKTDKKIFRILIAQGCVNACSFCAIRLIKGRLKSKPINLIMKELMLGLRSGYRHIKLVADDCGCYGLDIGQSLGVLLDKICAVKNAPDIKLAIHYTEPSGFLKNFKEIERAVALGILCQIAIPIQTTSQRLLKMMNRRYNAREVVEKVKELKSKGKVHVSTDVIFGFPAETRTEFLDTIAASAVFDSVQLLQFTQQKNTSAYSFKQVSTKEGKYRAEVALYLEKKYPKKYHYHRMF